MSQNSVSFIDFLLGWSKNMFFLIEKFSSIQDRNEQESSVQ